MDFIVRLICSSTVFLKPLLLIVQEIVSTGTYNLLTTPCDLCEITIIRQRISTSSPRNNVSVVVRAHREGVIHCRLQIARLYCASFQGLRCRTAKGKPLPQSVVLQSATWSSLNGRESSQLLVNSGILPAPRLAQRNPLHRCNLQCEDELWTNLNI